MIKIEKLEHFINGRTFSLPITHDILVDIFGKDYEKEMFLAFTCPYFFRYFIFFEEEEKVYFVTIEVGFDEIGLTNTNNNFQLICSSYWDKNIFYHEINDVMI